MTSEERAGKIITKLQRSGWKVGAVMEFPFLLKLIATELRVTVEEVSRMNKFCADAMELSKNQGKDEAYEDAARIAETIYTNGEAKIAGEGIASVIRARTNEME